MKEAIKHVEVDYKHYKKIGNRKKVATCETILRALNKQVVIPVPSEYYVKGKCYSCQSLNQEGNYCSNCGQRLK